MNWLQPHLPQAPPRRFGGLQGLAEIFRFKNGKVVEIWNHRDDLGLMQQFNAPIYAGSSDP